MSTPSAPVISNAPLANPNKLGFFWYPPLNDGGQPIIDYQLVLNPGGITCNVGSPGNYYEVTGLSNAVTYFTTIAASNTNGLGETASFREFQPGSPPSNGVSSLGAATVIASTGSALVSWTPPTTTPDATIFWYVVKGYTTTNLLTPFLKLTADGQTQSNLFIENLSKDSNYFFTVSAVNCPGYSIPLSTNIIQFFDPGQAKLATRIGGSNTYSESRTATDSSGNVFVLYKTTSATTGRHEVYDYTSAPVGGGNVGTTFRATITGGLMYLIKYDNVGICQWGTIIPNTTESEQTIEVPDLFCDSSNNVYVTGVGNFGTVNLFEFANISTGTINTSNRATISFVGYNRNMYLLKYNTNGKLEWANRASVNGGPSGSDLPTIIKPYVYVKNNDVFVGFNAGVSNTVVTFNNFSSISGGVVNLTTYGTYTIPASNFSGFLLKYNTSGVIQWVTVVDNIARDISFRNSVAVTNDSLGNVYFTGRANVQAITIKNFASAPSPPGSAIVLTTFSTINYTTSVNYLVQYNSSGVAQWTTYTTMPGQYRVYPVMSTDSSRNLYLTFGPVFGGTVTVYSASNSVTSFGSIGTSDVSVLITKYNSSGNVLWVNRIINGAQVPCDSMCDADGNLYVSFGYEIAFGINAPILENYVTSVAGNISTSRYGTIPQGTVGSEESYLVKYNPNGTVSWGTRIGGTLAEKTGGLSLIDNDLWVVGIYASNPVTIMNFSSAPLTQGGNVVLSTFGSLPDVNTGSGNNIFVVKYAK